jgi:hypothetical protein
MAVTTPDRFPGPLSEEEIQLEELDTDPTLVGAIRNVLGEIKAKDDLGVFNIRSGGAAGAHESLRQLIHLADGVGGPFEGFTSGAYREITPTATPYPTAVIWWESSSKLKKIVEKTITWGTSPKVPTQVKWKAYDTDGSTVLVTVTDTITHSGVFETSRTRAVA